MAKKCNYCGKLNENKARYCNYCGYPLIENNKNPFEIGSKGLIITYILTILLSWGGILLFLLSTWSGIGFIGMTGLFIPFYLMNSSNPNLKKHAYIQLIISLSGLFLGGYLFLNIL